jgi:ABC-2 type transport system ATP-binding protein
MTTGLPIEVAGLTKRFGSVTAVDDLSFVVAPGQVTGFLGPNGAGKTTTLRCLLGLVHPTSGSATIGGSSYAALDRPLHTVGSVLEASSFHPGRSALRHLEVLALASGVARGRAREVLAQVGLHDYADRRVGAYSLGMRQRLGLAGALLGDPGVLILDEPANGLDPAGIVWLRGFLRALAGEGRTVLFSSHVLTEVQQTVDRVVVLARGRLVREASLADLESGPSVVRVQTPTPEALLDALAGMAVVAERDAGALRVTGATAAEVGHVAFRAGVELHGLATEASDLEEVFLDLTGDPGDPGATNGADHTVPGSVA